MVFSVPALSLVDSDSPADVLCVVSSCPVAGYWPVFSPSSILSLPCLDSSLGGSTFSMGLFTIGVNNNFASANICAIVMGGSALKKVLKLLKLLVHPLLLLMYSFFNFMYLLCRNVSQFFIPCFVLCELLSLSRRTTTVPKLSNAADPPSNSFTLVTIGSPCFLSSSSFLL